MGWGDEVLVTGQARVLQEKDPRKVKIIYEKPRWHEAWFNNPRIAQPDEKGDFQELRPRNNYLRPYMVAKSNDRWTWKAWGPPKGELYFKDAELKTGEKYPDRIILEPHLKPGASPNKQWPWDRWQTLAKMLCQDGFKVAQMGESQKKALEGAEFIWTRSMRLAATVVAKAKAVIVPEGALHHVAAVVNVPAVVLFGGYISPAVTGYEGQASLFEHTPEHPLGCGWRVHCQHCVDAMAKITPERVFEELKRQLG